MLEPAVDLSGLPDTLLDTPPGELPLHEFTRTLRRINLYTEYAPQWWAVMKAWPDQFDNLYDALNDLHRWTDPLLSEAESLKWLSVGVLPEHGESIRLDLGYGPDRYLQVCEYFNADPFNYETTEHVCRISLTPDWLTSTIPADRAVAYTHADISFDEAARTWEPRVAAGEDVLPELRTLGALLRNMSEPEPYPLS